MIKTDKLETLSYLKNDEYGIYRKNINWPTPLHLILRT